MEQPPVVRYGKRSFRPLYHWEGVVESVNEDGFYARLVPFEGGRPNRAKVEYSDFYFADLAEESDIDLVQEGATFYWTIGKSRNRAGTLQNAYLVRFRRVPSASPEQRRVALARAREILAGSRSPS